MIKGELLEEIIVDMGLVDDLLDEVNAIFHEKKTCKIAQKALFFAILDDPRYRAILPIRNERDKVEAVKMRVAIEALDRYDGGEKFKS